MSLVTGLFFPALLLNQQLSPLLRLQVSHYSTFRIMCDVPSIAVYRMFSWYGFQIFILFYYSSGSNYYWYNHTFQVPHSLYLYT
jgi:hypothetical protein